MGLSRRGHCSYKAIDVFFETMRKLLQGKTKESRVLALAYIGSYWQTS